MYKLDKKDKKILFQLDIDSRQSFKQIAKKVGLSREVVQYRIKQLEKQGVIKGYQTIIDMTKLGYINCRFFIKFQKDTLKDENIIIEYYKKHPKFWWVASPDSYRDLGLACWVKNIYEFSELKQDLIKRFGDYISELEIAIYSKMHIFKRKYLQNVKVAQKEMFFPEIAEHDDKDLKILRLISSNARISSVELSQKTKMSITNINYRIKKMIEKGIIVNFGVVLDLNKIGYYWYKIEFKLNDLSVKQPIIEFCNKHPNIVFAYETLSDKDLEVELEVENYEKFREVLNTLRELFGKNIKEYYHFLWYKEHKFSFFI
jgi:DNA-binding Lrp family transcriptional regulator